MHQLMHRHLGKVVAGAAIALTGTAVMAAITLPADAGAADGTGARPVAAGATAPGRDPGPPPPGVVEEARAPGSRGQGRDPLTDDELRRAQDLALPRPVRGLARDVGGRPGPEPLAVSGFVYRGRAEGDAPGALAACGEHRCVRLFTKIKNGQWRPSPGPPLLTGGHDPPSVPAHRHAGRRSRAARRDRPDGRSDRPGRPRRTRRRAAPHALM